MPTERPRFPADFHHEAWEEDLARSTDIGRSAGETVRHECEQKGVPQNQLRLCDADGRDGTALPRCVKLYVPQPSGRFGMVFRVTQIDGQLRLAFLAFGVRHHPPGSNAPTVYQIAHDRLHGTSHVGRHL
jgi:hypothetical protein